MDDWHHQTSNKQVNLTPPCSLILYIPVLIILKIQAGEPCYLGLSSFELKENQKEKPTLGGLNPTRTHTQLQEASGMCPGAEIDG